MGGETVSAAHASQIGGGLSPRGRGNRGVGHRLQPCRGSIPAWAGKPPAYDLPHDIGGVYPRVGGETIRRMHAGEHVPGLSPRGRGNPARVCRDQELLWSIPAWAGKPWR